MGNLYVQNGLFVCVPWGALDPVGVHMCGHVASVSHSWESWPGCTHRHSCPAPEQQSPRKCPFWPRHPASICLSLYDFFPMWSQGCQEPANTSSHGDKTYKGLWGFRRCECMPVSTGPRPLTPWYASTLRAAKLLVWGWKGEGRSLAKGDSQTFQKQPPDHPSIHSPSHPSIPRRARVCAYLG